MAGIGRSSLEQADNDNDHDNDDDDDDGDDYDNDMFIMMMSMVMIKIMKNKVIMPRESLDSLLLTDPPAFPGAALQTRSSLIHSFI